MRGRTPSAGIASHARTAYPDQTDRKQFRTGEREVELINAYHRLVPGLISGLAILLLLAMPFAGRSDAQTTAVPNWWRVIAEKLECTSIANNDERARCSFSAPSRAVAGYTNTGSVLLTETYVIGAPAPRPIRSDGTRNLSIVMEIRGGYEAPGEGYYDRAAKKIYTSGFGLEQSSDCPAAPGVVKDVLQKMGIAYRGGIRINRCSWKYYSQNVNSRFEIDFTTEFGTAAAPTSACRTDILQGSWRAERATLAATGHAVTFAVAPSVPAHDGGQKAQRGVFTVFPAHKNKLALLPNPLFTAARGFEVDAGMCLIPVVSQRDSGTSRSAVLVNKSGSILRFYNDNAYRWVGTSYRLDAALPGNQVVGLEGNWRRGEPPVAAKTCTPADFNGRWNRSDGARITIRGTGNDGIGGTASMDENPGNWVQGQSKYTNIRIKDACTYTAKCYASERTRTNGRPDFRMIESACELRFDPVKRTLRELGTANSYVYTKADGNAATTTGQRRPAAVPPQPTPEPVETVTAAELNAKQAEAAKREAAAIAARRRAIAAQQAARERAYQQALADHRAKIAETDRKAQEEQAKWRAAVAACAAGDRSQCAPRP